MAAVTPAIRAPRTAPVTSRERADLRVIRAHHRARTVGTLSTIVGTFILLLLFMLAGLHAVLVQTQATLDSVDAEISTLEVQRNEALAELAWHDSPDGLAEAASLAGLALATDVEMLAPVAEGELGPPIRPNPFAGVSG